MEKEQDNKGHEKEFPIIVNTREKKWLDEQISYEQVVAIAYPSATNDSNIVYTVDYKKGHEEGSLTAGQKVEVKNGMVFNVTSTNKS